MKPTVSVKQKPTPCSEVEGVGSWGRESRRADAPPATREPVSALRSVDCQRCVANDRRRLQLGRRRPVRCWWRCERTLLDLTLEVRACACRMRRRSGPRSAARRNHRELPPHLDGPPTCVAVSRRTRRSAAAVSMVAGAARRPSLKPALVRARVLGEDLEDHFGPVEHPRLQLELQVSAAAAAEVVVADDQVERTFEPFRSRSSSTLPMPMK